MNKSTFHTIRLVRLVLACTLLLGAGQATQAKGTKKKEIPSTRIIRVDVQKKSTPLSEMPLLCVGAGRAHEGLMANWQKQLKEVQKECNFKYIRFHGLLHDDMGVYKFYNGKPQYNFQYIDALYDFLLSVNIKPFVELGFMPKALRSGEKTVFWWKGNVTPPSDYARYKELIKKLVEHLTDRYGEEEVKQWYFEVWNEPNFHGFFSGTIDDYFKMYQHAAEAVKEVNQDYRVGGPATAGCGWIPETIEFTRKNNVPLDFLSTHTYGTHGVLDEFGTRANFLIPNPQCVPNDVKKVRKQIDDRGLENMELHFTEFNTSYSPRDPVHDTYQNAAYILDVLKNTTGHVSSMSYWTFTDIFEEPGTVDKPFHGGFGMMNWQGIRKPTFYTYAFYNQLFDQEIATDDKQSWVTINDKGEIAALVYDFTLPKQGKENNVVYFTQLHPATQKGTIELSLNNLEDGDYILECQEVGFKKHDAQSMYIEMGKPNTLSLAQEKMLRQMSVSNKISTRVEVRNHQINIPLNWESNNFHFVRLIKEK